MSKKDNFNQAFYEMFGVGKKPMEGETSPSPEETLFDIEESARKEVNRTMEPPAQHAAKTYFAPGVTIEGTVSTKGDIEIAGELKGNLVADGIATIRSNLKGNVTAAGLCVFDCTFEGEITVSGRVQISENSRVIGNIHADEVSCAGSIEGDMFVRSHVTLAGKAQVQGNISTKTMTMAHGARLCGKLEMKND